MKNDRFDIIEQLKAENYTVEQLEKKINSECPNGINGKMSEMLKALLSLRQRKLNKTFEWTPKDVEKLLLLDKEMIVCCEKMYDEAKPLEAALKQRIENKDSFLHDFELEAKLTPCILLPDEDGEMNEPWDGIECVLNESLNEFDLCYRISALENILNNCRNKEFNWSIDRIFKGNFDGQYVSYLIHELYDHNDAWSIPDILKINDLSAELYIRHQHFVTLTEDKNDCEI